MGREGSAVDDYSKPLPRNRIVFWSPGGFLDVLSLDYNGLGFFRKA